MKWQDKIFWNMQVPNLNDHNIQLADLSRHYGIEEGKVFLVYAPLAGVFFLADADTVQRLEAFVENGDDEEMEELWAQLKENSEDYRSSIVEEPSQFTRLSILPNLTCNLSCAYCYSAKGRSKMEIDESHLKIMLDYFIDCHRTSSRHLSIFISGGGEPLLSWEKLRFILGYSRQRAVAQGFTLDIFLMTNGTLITFDIAHELKEQDVNVGVSFEILPDVQDSQRGSFHKVSQNIRLLLDMGIVPNISSVITGLNVDRMEEMADTVASSYPGIRHLNFDPAMSSDIFPDSERLDAFYQKFIHNFFKAKELCKKYGMTLDCNVVRKAEKLFPRYCQGKLCLTPEGKISICHSVSSPREAAYQKVVYGEIRNGQLAFDTGKFKSFIDKGNFLLPRCHSCIARWHCAGGCMMYRMNYNEEQFEAVCRFTAYAITEILLKRLDASFKKEQGQSIRQLLGITNI